MISWSRIVLGLSKFKFIHALHAHRGLTQTWIYKVYRIWSRGKFPGKDVNGNYELSRIKISIDFRVKRVGMKK